MVIFKFSDVFLIFFRNEIFIDWSSSLSSYKIKKSYLNRMIRPYKIKKNKKLHLRNQRERNCVALTWFLFFLEIKKIMKNFEMIEIPIECRSENEKSTQYRMVLLVWNEIKAKEMWRYAHQNQQSDFGCNFFSLAAFNCCCLCLLCTVQK